MNLAAKAGVKKVTTEVTVIRADGTVQNYGAVSSSSAGIVKRLFVRWRTQRLNRAAHRANPEVPL